MNAAIEKAPLQRILSLCGGEEETGGILIGRYTSDGQRALIVEVTGPPPGSTAGRDWPPLGRGGLEALLAKRWRDTPRTYYLGEWHYHPDHSPPSTQDLHPLRSIAGDPRYQCAHPLLLVVSSAADGHLLLRWFVPFGVEAHDAE